MPEKHSSSNLDSASSSNENQTKVTINANNRTKIKQDYISNSIARNLSSQERKPIQTAYNEFETYQKWLQDKIAEEKRIFEYELFEFIWIIIKKQPMKQNVLKNLVSTINRARLSFYKERLEELNKNENQNLISNWLSPKYCVNSFL